MMRLDLDLKPAQGFWETPRNLAMVVAAAAALAGALGFELGRREPIQQRPIVIVLQARAPLPARP
jgi:anti-sigma-K factor RskA